MPSIVVGRHDTHATLPELREAHGPSRERLAALAEISTRTIYNSSILVIANEDRDGFFLTISRALFLSSEAIPLAPGHEFWRGLHYVTDRGMVTSASSRPMTDPRRSAGVCPGDPRLPGGASRVRRA